MKRFLSALVIFLITTVSINSFAYNTDPKLFVEELVDDAIKTLSNKSISKADKNKKIEEIALANVDIDALGMYTLGDIRKTLDENNLKKYKTLFEKYFLKSLTSRLTDY